MSELPFSQACENNKQPILEILMRHMPAAGQVLEIGGGTGQHAVYFAKHFPAVHWQSTDLAEHVDALNLRINDAALPNLPAATPLDVNSRPWGCSSADLIFTANTFHIMSAGSVENFFAQVTEHCNSQARLLAYGPFKYDGEFTTDSNANFDVWLKQRDPVSGIRDFEWVNQMALEAGFQFSEDNAMPANNQLLVWSLP